jgi:hypothetical protein
MSDRHRYPDALEEVLIEEGRLPAPRRAFSLGDIEPGWEVLGNTEEWIGTVELVEEECIVVRRGLFSPKVYVPLSAVGQVRDGSVILNVPAKWIATLGWKQPPRVQHAVSGRQQGR